MTPAERKKVLEHLAAGKISVEAASELLNGSARPDQPNEAAASEKRKARFLRIAVDSPGTEQVNVRIPIAFLKHGMSFLGILPVDLCKKLADLESEDADNPEQRKLLKALEEFYVKISPGDKKNVCISIE